MDSKNKTLICILGPTAIGKTSLSILLAKYFKTEIISCDSRQFYKEMTIGTAVPEQEELQDVPHHFIQNRSIIEEYNVGAFERDALMTLEKLFKKHDQLIMVGGSGLYIDAVLKGFDKFPKVDQSIRKKLTERFEKEGIIPLQEELKELDIKSYNSIDLENPQRLIRALEICVGTNLPYSSFKGKTKEKRSFSTIKIGLHGERQKMYDRINLRVDLMIKKGLIEEATRLYPNKNLNALQTVGYKELFLLNDDVYTKEFAVEEIKKNTRRFAKRQLTWFRKDKEIIWFDFEEDSKKIIKMIENNL
ncbi:MAG: tRNA dimethylallyltransferase [Flavobacterium sp. SCGC AAA160-P02]|nr:MAG: tRNA dimethylallyltransferase [Flavobacterium sp. SCGC AAA160-P02]